MNINSNLLKSINDCMDYKGIDIELSRNFNKDFFNIYDEVKKDNIRTYIQARYMDSNMFLYTFSRMLEEGKINISYNENATIKDINYLEKLSEDL